MERKKRHGEKKKGKIGKPQFRNRVKQSLFVDVPLRAVFLRRYPLAQNRGPFPHGLALTLSLLSVCRSSSSTIARGYAAGECAYRKTIAAGTYEINGP